MQHWSKQQQWGLIWMETFKSKISQVKSIKSFGKFDEAELHSKTSKDLTSTSPGGFLQKKIYKWQNNGSKFCKTTTLVWWERMKHQKERGGQAAWGGSLPVSFFLSAGLAPLPLYSYHFCITVSFDSIYTVVLYHTQISTSGSCTDAMAWPYSHIWTKQLQEEFRYTSSCYCSTMFGKLGLQSFIWRSSKKQTQPKETDWDQENKLRYSWRLWQHEISHTHMNKHTHTHTCRKTCTHACTHKHASTHTYAHTHYSMIKFYHTLKSDQDKKQGGGGGGGEPAATLTYTKVKH